MSLLDQGLVQADLFFLLQGNRFVHFFFRELLRVDQYLQDFVFNRCYHSPSLLRQIIPPSLHPVP